MKLEIYKYHGAGNDFIMIDGSKLPRKLSDEEIAQLCHRRFGIGADGIIIVSPDDTLDFIMEFYNSDGTHGFMCANGSRCALLFARECGILTDSYNFSCCDIKYQAILHSEEEATTFFPDLRIGDEIAGGYFVDTGAPHFVLFRNELGSLDPIAEGRNWRYAREFQPEGTNVNFILPREQDHLEIITYERGVESLTMACGTGALAAAIAFTQKNNIQGDQKIKLESDGGILTISFHRNEDRISNIGVRGPVKSVFNTSVVL